MPLLIYVFTSIMNYLLIEKFNKMLNEGKRSREECYVWLYDQENIEKEQKFFSSNDYIIDNILL